MDGSIWKFITDWWIFAFFPALTFLSLPNTGEFLKELERNEKFAPPDDRQIRWHIRHIRQDLQLLCRLVQILISLVAIALWQEFRK